MGGKNNNVSTKLEATYLLAHRWTEWLGIRSYDVTPYCWVYAFFKGKLNPYHPWPRPSKWMRKRQVGKSDFSEFKALVKQISLVKTDLNRAEKEDILAALIDYPKFKNKYPEFGPQDISSHGHRTDKRTSKSNRHASKRASVHPLYSLSHIVKFGGVLPWTIEKSRETDEKVKACLAGKVSVGEILIQEIMNDQSILGELKNVLQERGIAAFRDKFRRIADNTYRAVYGCFSRRGNKMPTPPKGWRKRCVERISDYFVQCDETNEKLQNLGGKLGTRKY